MRITWAVVMAAALVACGDNIHLETGVTCTEPSDCPGAETPCTKKACDDGQCGLTFVPAGTAIDMQTAGDCQKAQCDGAGLVEIVADDSDLPDDGNPCTTEGCANGVVQHGVEPIGTTCGSGLECDGGGSCVHCNLASECPGTDTDCQKRTCFFGVCGTDNTPAGTVAATQVKGDCQKLFCNGSGGTTSVEDDTDKPVDGNVCTFDVCTAGVPSNPDVPLGTSCGSGDTCDGNGSCVQCISPSDCPATGNECVFATCDSSGTCGTANADDGVVTQTQTPGDCHVTQCDGNGGTVEQIDDLDTPETGNDCVLGTCTDGVQGTQNANSGTTCGTGGTCDGNGNCVQ